MGINWLAIRGAGISTAGALVPGLWLAYWVATRRSRARQAVLAMLALLLVIPFFVVLHPAVAWQAPMLGAAAAVPVVVLGARAAMQSANAAYGNAARSLGASEWRVFWRILLPHSWRIVVAAIALAYVRVLAEWL